MVSTNTEIIYGNERYFKGYHDALSVVAQERVYLEMVEAPPLEKVCGFQRELIQKNGPVYYAISNDRVVGWCDVFPSDNPRQKHRGNLGMGLLPDFRGQGLGTKLLNEVLRHAKVFGLEKVELHVYTTNAPAIALYKRAGFEQEGLIRRYRKLGDQYFDCIAMGKFL